MLVRHPTAIVLSGHKESPLASQKAGAPDVTLDPTTVSKSCICSDGTASNSAPTSFSGSNIETILTVQTQATFDPGIHLPGFPGSFTLHGQAVQRVLQ